MAHKEHYDAVIVGGGFFGLYLAEYMAKKNLKVLLCEKETELMTRASMNNQARIHNGYHYPRSMLTAMRSRVSYNIFCKEFENCVFDTFEKYYLVGKVLSHITARQFEKFCERIQAPIEPAPWKIQKLINPDLIEAAYSTVEHAFDACKLRNLMIERIENLKIDIKTAAIVQRVSSIDSGLEVEIANASEDGDSRKISTAHVFNCTYSQINDLLNRSQLELIPLKHELTEICIVEAPNELRNVGITVMCGPFFSIMPYPVKNLHSFSHVRYTPHCTWHAENGKPFRSGEDVLRDFKHSSTWPKLIRDSQRYIPLLSECRHSESLYEVKTILPRSESDDSRPILFQPNYKLKGFHCLMGGKIDNVFDVVNVIENLKLV